MFRRLRAMFERLTTAGENFAATLEEGDARLRQTLGLDDPVEERALPPRPEVEAALGNGEPEKKGKRR